MSPPADLLPDLDRVTLLAQCGGDAVLASDILELMLEQVESALRVPGDGGSSQRAAMAHGLKGAARNCGALRLAGIAGEVEHDPASEAAAARLAEALAALAAILRREVSEHGTGG